MLEIRQPIFHRELTCNPIEAGANWLIDLNKEAFRGRAAVEHLWREGVPRARVGLRVDCDDPAAIRGASVLAADSIVGEIEHAVFSPSLGACVALASVSQPFAAASLPFECRSDEVGVEALSISAPYVIPTSWSVPIF
jgi:glycine cleavage system aminomethyltransferase T